MTTIKKGNPGILNKNITYFNILENIRFITVLLWCRALVISLDQYVTSHCICVLLSCDFDLMFKFQVECPKYPGFCISRQRKEYPFIEMFHSPQQVGTTHLIKCLVLVRFSVWLYMILFPILIFWENKLLLSIMFVCFVNVVYVENRG